MKKKTTLLLVAGLLSFGLLNACGSDNGEVTTDSGNVAQTTDGGGNVAHGTSAWGYNLSGVNGPTGLAFGGGTGQTDFSPITFTIYEEDIRSIITEENFQGQVSRQVTADTGVTIQTNFGVGDVSQQITLMIADQSFPDFVFSRSNVQRFLEAGAFIDMAPLIEQYGPNIRALYGDSFDAHFDEQGRIFFLGQNFVRRAPLDPENAFRLQLSALEALGYPEVRTLEQFSDVIRQYKALNPTINGQPTIGLTLTTGDGWRWFITLGNPAGAATGIANDGQYFVDPYTLETTWRFLLPEHREYFRWLNGLFDEGLLDPDAFTQTHDEYLSKISSGRVIGLIDADWHIDSAVDILIGSGHPYRAYGAFPVTISRDILHPGYRREAFLPSNGVGITINNQDPVRAIQFLDYLARREIQVMSNWGFEGIHWEIRDGQRRLTAQEQQRLDEDPHNHTVYTGRGMLSYPWPNYGTGGVCADGFHILPFGEDLIIANYPEAARQALDAYGVAMWRDLFPMEADLPAAQRFSPWGAAWHIADTVDPASELGQIQIRANDLTAEFLMRSVMAPPQEFDAIWDEYIRQLHNINIDRAGELMTELVRQRAAWYRP
ncbi:MAG: extracellular solute-binding protein [Defluviitaleaceae bacterium]|nr:extracellular solute-binding protein [Defluviitaleaceae bacterium]